MLVEKSLSDALKAFDKGREVLVLFEYDDGSISTEKLVDILDVDGAHYMVNVAGYEDPDFKALINRQMDNMRVQNMDCTGCIHKGNREFCLNCFRGGSRDYYLGEDKKDGQDK